MKERWLHFDDQKGAHEMTNNNLDLSLILEYSLS